MCLICLFLLSFLGDKYPWIDKFPAFTIDLKVSREVCTVFFIIQLSCLLCHLHIGLLLKGEILVHLLLRNSAAHDYWKYIVLSVIFHATCQYLFWSKLLNAMCATKIGVSWMYMFSKVHQGS